MSATGHRLRKKKALANAEAAEQKIDFSQLKVDELKQLAEAAGIEGFQSMKKAELVAALESAKGA